MAIRTITWTVDEDMHVSPTRVQNAGVQGDDNATRVVFSLPAFLQTGHKLYIEYVDGVSGYDKTDPLDVVDGAVGFDLPLKWTQHGGESTVRLVATKMIDNVETLVAHSKPECRIRFDGRAKAFAKIKSLIEGSIQAAQDRIAKMIADAKVWIDNVNGVYVGSGDMPDGCVIQIDPEGEAITVEDWIRTEGHALVDMLYPVGSIYMSVNRVDPSVLFGGTWEQLKDRFLLGAGGLYNAGLTGGEAMHTLSGSEIPNHTHKGQLRAYGAADWWGYNSDEVGVAFRFSEENDSHCFTKINKDKTAVVSAYADTGSYGGSSPHNNMPPYLAVYMWKRVA